MVRLLQLPGGAQGMERGLGGGKFPINKKPEGK